jgi:hypothetical protein
MISTFPEKQVYMEKAKKSGQNLGFVNKEEVILMVVLEKQSMSAFTKRL